MGRVKFTEKQMTLRYVENYKMERGCAICGYKKCASALVFHHKDPRIKKFGIAKGAWGNRPLHALLDEMEKCTVLCSNCHMELHEANA